MEKKQTPQTDDQLHLVFVGFDTDPSITQQIRQMLCSAHKVNATDPKSPLILVQNKYFSSKIGIKFVNSQEEFLALFKIKDNSPLNFVIIAKDPFSLRKIGLSAGDIRKIVLTGEINQSAFRSVWVATDFEKLDLSKFYDEFECFVHVSGLDPTRQFQNEHNQNILKEFFEDVENFTWNRAKAVNTNKSDSKATHNGVLRPLLKESEKAIISKSEEKENVEIEGTGLGGFPDRQSMEKFEELDTEFMSMFDKILNFNQQKMNLPSEQRKEEASNLILKLMEVLGKGEEAEGMSGTMGGEEEQQ